LRPQDADRYPAQISGETQKLIAPARAFMSDPDVLMLDAPTNGLDPIITHNANKPIRSATERGKTVFMISSNLRAAQEFSDHLLMLHEGVIVWAGTTEEARHAEEPRLRQLLEGCSDGPIRMAVRA